VAKQKLDNVLAAVPLFDGLSRRHLKHLADRAEVADYMEGHTIVKEGDDGDAFFVILTGQAKITVGNKVINRAMPGDHFGEISLLDGQPRTATVSSETPMTLLVLTRRAFMKALEQDASIALHLAASLAKRVRQNTRSLTS
jgi:CRP/FNR family transcriptional regulator, cyclic AMP receptor protein